MVIRDILKAKKRGLFATFAHVLPQNTDGGAASGAPILGYRALNTVIHNGLYPFVSLSANAVVFSAQAEGRFLIDIEAACYDVAGTYLDLQFRSDSHRGASVFADQAGSSILTAQAFFTKEAGSSESIYVRQYFESTVGTTDAGKATNFDDEHYVIFNLYRVD